MRWILLIFVLGCVPMTELERGGCVVCGHGWCCERPVNAEKICLEESR